MGKKELWKFRAAKPCRYNLQAQANSYGKKETRPSMNSRDGFEWMVGFLSSLRTCTLTCVCVCVYICCVYIHIHAHAFLWNNFYRIIQMVVLTSRAVREETETQKAQVKSKVK